MSGKPINPKEIAMSDTKRPYDVQDSDEFLAMESDNHAAEGGDWVLLHNGGNVSIHGPDARWVEIPRDQFNALVDWYLKPQSLKGPSP